MVPVWPSGNRYVPHSTHLEVQVRGYYGGAVQREFRTPEYPEILGGQPEKFRIKSKAGKEGVLRPR